MIRVANCGAKITVPTSCILGALVFTAGVVVTLDPSPVTAQAQEQNAIMTCSIAAYYTRAHGDEKLREIMATVQRPTVLEDFVHGFESEIDTIAGHPEL